MSISERFFNYFEGKCNPYPLATFRIFFYLGILIHFLPTFVHFEENYGVNAVRSIEWEKIIFEMSLQTPQYVLKIFAAITLIFILLGTLGQWPRISALGTALGTYFFASINALNVQTLFLGSMWAILIEMAVSGGGNEVLSLPKFFHRPLPAQGSLFGRRLILFQIILIFFFAGIEKLYQGWPVVNHMHNLMRYPSGSVLRDWAVGNSFLSLSIVGYAMNISTIIMQLGSPLFIYYKKTRLLYFFAFQLFFLGIVSLMSVPVLAYCIYAPGGLLFLDDYIFEKMCSGLSPTTAQKISP